MFVGHFSSHSEGIWPKNEELAIAERQYGVVTGMQLRECGLSSSQIQRRVSTGRLEPIFPSVFRVVGSVRTDRQRAISATLWLGASVSHVTAGAMLQLDGVRTDALHLTVAVESRQGRGRSDIVLHRSALPKHDRRVVDGIPCTSAARTLVDCAAVLDDEALEVAFESARRLGLATSATVQRVLESGHRAGFARMRRVLAAAETRPLESRLEVKLARLLRSSKLPRSVSQFRLGDYRLDRAWPDARVAVEADGFQHHGQRLVWKRDRRRIAAIEAFGRRVVHVTWDDVTITPDRTVDRLAIALSRIAA